MKLMLKKELHWAHSRMVPQDQNIAEKPVAFTHHAVFRITSFQAYSARDSEQTDPFVQSV